MAVTVLIPGVDSRVYNSKERFEQGYWSDSVVVLADRRDYSEALTVREYSPKHVIHDREEGFEIAIRRVSVVFSGGACRATHRPCFDTL